MAGRWVVATYDFDAVNDDELGFKAGQVIRVIRDVDGDWQEGELNSKQGIFPRNHVEPTAAPPSKAPSGPAKPMARAAFDFVGEQAGDLSFSAGDEIELVSEVDAEWFEGRFKGKNGIFPKQFVEVVVPLPVAARKNTVSARRLTQANIKALGSEPHAVATFEFDGRAEDELSFKTGDRIVLTKKIDDEWYEGTLKGKTGIFPVAFVNIVTDITATKAPPAKPAPTLPAPKAKAPPTQPPPARAASTSKPKPAPVKRQEKADSLATTPHAKALYEYTAECDDDLAFQPDDIICLTKEVDKEWLEGYLQKDPSKKTGIFPVNFVEVVVKLGAGVQVPLPKPKPRSPTVTPRHGTGTSVKPPVKPPPVRTSTIMSSSGSLSRKPPPPRGAPPPRASVSERTASTSQTPAPQPRARPAPAARRDTSAKPAPARPSVSVRRRSTAAKPALPQRRASVVGRSVSPPPMVVAAPPTKGVSSSVLAAVDKSLKQLETDIAEQTEKQLSLEAFLEVLEEGSPERDEVEASLQECLATIGQLEAKHKQAAARRKQLAGDDADSGDESSGGGGGSSAPVEDGSIAVIAMIKDIDNQIKQLKRSLQIETKTAMGATKLAKLAQQGGGVDVAKVEEEAASARAAVETTKVKIEELKSKRTAAVSTLGYDPAIHPSPADSKKLAQRGKVVDELMKTEEEFVKDMQVCIRGYVHNCPEGLDGPAVFCNLEDVVATANAFMHDLQKEVKTDHQSVGGVFLNFVPRIRSCYVKYCCNRSRSQAAVADYCAQPEQKERLAACHRAISQETSSWDLESFLVKPVQRVLKYPLLLRELVKSTPDVHPDYESILEAQKMLDDVAKDINEGTRQTELVTRYQKEKNTSAGFLGNLEKMTWHSTKKKTMRINQRIFNTVLARQDEADHPVFSAHHQRLKDLEQAAKKLRKRTQDHLLIFKEMFDTASALFKHFVDIAHDKDKSLLPAAVVLKQASDKMEQLLRMHVTSATARVIEPISKFLDLFQGPQFFIDKRADKQLDYDSWTRKVKAAAKDPEKLRLAQKELDVAKNTFEAINAQLEDDLPKFNAAGQALMDRCKLALVRAEKQVLASVHGVLAELLAHDPDGSSLSHISERCQKRVELAVMSFLELAIVPRSLSREFGVACPTIVARKAVELPPMLQPSAQARTTPLPRAPNRNSNRFSTASTTSTVQAPVRASVPAPQTSLDEADYPVAFVRYDFEAENDAELDLRAGVEVKVLQRYDKAGNHEWWLVQRGDGQTGFVPESFLLETDDGAPPPELQPPTPAARGSTASKTSKAKVLYDFEPTSDAELLVLEGDIVEILARADPEGNEEWWEVQKDGQSGFVPAVYMESL